MERITLGQHQGVKNNRYGAEKQVYHPPCSMHEHFGTSLPVLLLLHLSQERLCLVKLYKPPQSKTLIKLVQLLYLFVLC